MNEELGAIISSLTMVMQEETERLKRRESPIDLQPLAAAKGRLISNLDEALTRRERANPDWYAQLDEEPKAILVTLLSELVSVSQVNAKVLERQIELSRDMLGAITNEALRVNGSRAVVYGARGDMAGKDLSTPISFNYEY